MHSYQNAHVFIWLQKQNRIYCINKNKRETNNESEIELLGFLPLSTLLNDQC